MGDRCEGCPLDAFLDRLVEALVARLAPPAPPPPPKKDRLISATEACERLGWSRRTLDRRRRSLPFVKLRPTRGYDVIESRLDDFIRSIR